MSRPLVPVPDRLRGLVDHHRSAGFGQPTVAVRPERWVAGLGAHASALDGFPEQLDRDTVRGLTRSGSSNADGGLVGFVATQIWGYGTTGYGPARLAAALSFQGLPEVLREVGDRLASRDPVGAFRVLCVEHRIPRLGMAFGSKYLYFADLHRRALILDRVIRDWLAEHAGVSLGGRRDEREYAVWLLVAEQWSSSLGVALDQLEMLIFTDGLPETSSWRPEPATASVRDTTRSWRPMTCADAIANVLESAVDGMRAADLARQINRERLYERGDGQPLPAYQVSSIAHANRDRFRIAAGVIALQTQGTPSAPAGRRDRHRASSPRTARRPKSVNTTDGTRVILLGCVKQKHDPPAAAKDLYRSRLWTARRSYAEASSSTCSSSVIGDIPTYRVG